MLIGKYYKLKYKLIEIVCYFFYISFVDSIKIFFLKRKDYKLSGHTNNLNKLPWKISLDDKIVVVIDDTVPRSDFSAGGKTLINYINIYQTLGYTVKFLPDDFLKREPYTTHMENKGIEVLCGKWWENNYTKWFYDNKDKISFVMLNAPRSIKYIDFFKKIIKTKVLYYDMDIYFVREKLMFEVTKNKKYLRESKYHKVIERKLFNEADIVLTISDKENKFIRTFTGKDNVFTIPCYVYKDFNIDYKAKERKNLLFVGGEKQKANLDGIKWFMDKVFPDVCEKYKDIQLIIVGLYSNNFKKQYQSDNIIFTGKVTDEQLRELYITSKMSLAPLRFGAGVKGKVVEAIHYGLPVISTNFGVEGLTGAEKFIIVKNNEKDFTNAILELYKNDNVLEELSTESTKYSKEHFSFETAINIIKNITRN